MASSDKLITSFDFAPGRLLARKYVVGELLGAGWEGEVYHVTEAATGIERAAKFFFPQRNPGNRAVKFYATKLHKLQDCDMVIKYHTQETFNWRKEPITFMVSEYVEGELLSGLVARQPNGHLEVFEAMHLLHALTVGVEQIHHFGEYHGDLHAENIIVRRRGLGFDIKVVDFYHWGRRTREHVLDDVAGLIRLFYDSLGGQKRYAQQPPQVKMICCGLKRSLMAKKFRSPAKLRQFLEALPWDEG